MVQNPNFPLIDEAMSWSSGPTSAANPFLWGSIKRRTEGDSTNSRGKQYELDQYQTGRAATTVQNTDGAWDPENTGSPFYPNLNAYRYYRTRAQYPPTVNLLTAAQATAFVQPNDDLTTQGPLVATLPYYTDNGSGPYSTTAPAGGAYKTTLPVTPVNGSNVLRFGGVSADIGQPFSAQVRVASTVSISMRLRIVWWNSVGGLISSTLGTAQTVTAAVVVSVANAVAPAGAVGMTIELFINSSPASSAVLTMDRPQVEQATAITSYVQPSRWYPLFCGLALQYPQGWTDAGSYGTAALGAVDIFGWLSQRKLLSPAYMEALVLAPDFLFALDEPSSATACLDATGNTSSPAPLKLLGGATASSIVLGTQLENGTWDGTTPGSITALTAVTPPGFLPAGLGGPVARLFQAGGLSGPTTAIDIGTARGTVGPGTTGTGWTRFVAFNTHQSSGVSNPQTIWAAEDPTSSQYIRFYLHGTNVVVAVAGPAGVSSTTFVGAVTDSEWHLLVVTLSTDGKTLLMYLDNFSPITGTTATSMNPTTFTTSGSTDWIGASQIQPLGLYGDIAYAGQFPFPLSAVQVTLLYQTLAYGGSVDDELHYTSATRYADILRWSGYQGASAIDQYSTASVVSYGKPSDLWATRDSGGTNPVAALQTVVDTENGTHFVSASGAITFKSRRARYNQDTPVVIFGENTAGGEIPYVDVTLNYDPTRVGNDAQLTQTNTGQVTTVGNAASKLTYGDVPIQRSINTTDSNEMLAAGQFLVARFGTQMKRIQVIRVPVSSFTVAGAPNAAAWTACLGLEIGARVRVMRRPPGGFTSQLEGFVESVAWKRDDKANMFVELQVSPAQGLDYWELGSSHTTLHTATIVGATSATFDFLPDHATNAIQSNISIRGTDIYTWVIDWGLSTAEFFSMTPTVNSPGYTTWVATIGQTERMDTGVVNAGFQFAHSVNAVIQDIGRYVFEAGNVKTLPNPELASYLVPASALDAYSTLGTSTIVGY